MGPLGLIAGEGVFPTLVARGARAAGRRVVCIAFAGSAGESLRDDVDEFHWVSIVRPGSWIRKLRRAGCSEAIMVGRVRKTKLYDRGLLAQASRIPDWRAIRIWFTVFRHDKRPQTILQTLGRELGGAGITLIDSTKYIPDQLATPGAMTRREPTAQQWEDIRYGFPLCTQLSKQDIGQAIAVLNHEVIAVEALEGTNAMIERAGSLVRIGGWTLIKVANCVEDMRMDVPTIGITTIEKLAAAKAGCIVLEPGKTIMLEKQKVLELADRHKIAIVGYQKKRSKTMPIHAPILAQIEELESLRSQRDDHWQIPRVEGDLIYHIALAANAKLIVEIGTSYGFSGLHWGAALWQTGGKMHTIDLAQKKFDASKATFAKAGLSQIITNHLGDARQILATISGPIDLALIDADKASTQAYFDLLWPKVRPGGSVLTDNATTHRKELGEYVRHVRSLADASSIEVAVGNGIEWTIKKPK